MKIACIVDTISRNAGGMHTSVRRLMQCLSSLGPEVGVFTITDEFSNEDVAKWSPLSVSFSRSFGPRRIGFAPGLSADVARFSPDLLSTHGLWTYTSYVSGRWHRRTGGPCFIHPHGMLDPWAVRHSGWKKRIAGMLFENRHLRDAGCIRALCREEADALRAYGIPAPVAILPNGIDLPEERGDRNEERGKASGEPKTLLYLGRIHPKKGLENLIRAWATNATDEWRLLIGGWEERGHADELKCLCQELGIAFSTTSETDPIPWSEGNGSKKSGSVTFLGPVFGEAKDCLLRSVDAFILPSFSEGLPMTILEAWAYRLPVVKTPPCNLPEGFEAGAALAVEPDATSIAQGLKTLFSMTDRARREMGERGRALVESRFLWSGIAKQIGEVHEWLLGGGPKPGCVE